MVTDAVVIAREKLYPTPGRNYRAAWKWLYKVKVDGQEFTGDRLGWAETLAKKKANGRPVIREWEAA